MVRKQEYSNNLRNNSSLFLYQNSTSNSFLNINFQVESKTVSLSFSCFVILKFISLSCTLNECFISTNEFVILCIGYLKNSDLLNFANLPNWTLFIMQGQKFTLTNTTINHIRKVLSIRKLSDRQQQIEVYHNLIFAWGLS